MSKTWFLYSNDIVSGPFSTEEVQTKLGSGQVSLQSFIWWKGQREWIAMSVWQEQLPHLLDNSGAASQKPVWYMDVGTAPIGPLTQTEMIENLKKINELGRVRLWTVGMDKWKSLFELHDVMELLGVSRRESDRAPLMGTAAITRSNEDPRGFVARTASVSVGGLGLSKAHDLRRGDNIAILIKSPDLPSALHVRGEVVYVTDAGYAGIRFIKAQAETLSIIHDYVKRFTDAKASEEAA